jgi:hypothetical protein
MTRGREGRRECVGDGGTSICLTFKFAVRRVGVGVGVGGGVGVGVGVTGVVLNKKRLYKDFIHDLDGDGDAGYREEFTPTGGRSWENSGVTPGRGHHFPGVVIQYFHLEFLPGAHDTIYYFYTIYCLAYTLEHFILYESFVS